MNESVNTANASIHVVAACDEKYAMPLAVMLSSIETHLASDRKVTFYVLGSRVSPSTREKVERSITSTAIDVSWVFVEADRLDSLQGTLRSFDTVSIESYYRLLLPELLPGDLHKVIYLDCDVVVNRDLGALWDHDVSDTYLLAVPEFSRDSRFVSSKAGIRLYRELGLPARLKFFNSGVMVLNLRRCRAGRIMQRALTYLNAAKDDLRWHDQEGLNVAAAGEWKELDPRWNVTMHLFRESNDGRDIADCLRDPYIIHYNSAIKPWQPDFSYGFRDLFFQYLDRTAWTGWRTRRSRFGVAARLGRMLLRAARKRQHAMRRYLSKERLRWHRRWVLYRPLRRLDRGRIPSNRAREIRVFIVCDRPDPSLSYLLSHYLGSGVDRALIAFTGSSASDFEAWIQASKRIHLFSLGPRDRSPHEVLRYLLHWHGVGHWCLVIDSNELLHYPHAEALPLNDLCTHLEEAGYDAMICHAIEMSASMKSPQRFYREGEGSHDDYPYPDPRLQKVPTVARDPLTGRVFPCLQLLGDAGDPLGAMEGDCSRVALLKFRRDLHLAENLRAIYGAHLAELEGLLLRYRDPQTSGENSSRPE